MAPAQMALPLSLAAGSARSSPPRDDDGPVASDIDAQFATWVQQNQEIVFWLRQRALELKQTRPRYSIKKLFEEARWDTRLSERFGELKLNNNWHSRMARWLMESAPELRGFFKTRRLG